MRRRNFLSVRKKGEVASAVTGDQRDDDPADAAGWSNARVLRAECLEWLLTDREASRLVSNRGVQMEGMRIDGRVDLQDAQIGVPIVAFRCSFDKNRDLVLRNARIRSFYLLGSLVKALECENLQVEGDVFLRRGFKAEGIVDFRRAKIAGNLECDGAQFFNHGGPALSADGARISGGAFLRGAKVEGEVRLTGVTIGTNLELEDSQFLNSQGDSCAAAGANVGGNVFLRRLKAEGIVDFERATISLRKSGVRRSSIFQP